MRHLALQLILLEGGVLAGVLIALNKLGSEVVEVHSALRLIVGVATGIFAAGGLVEAFAAVRAPALPPVPDRPLPRTTAIIPAYLPNEESIVLDTIAKHLRNGPPNHEVIVAYNSPTPMAIESALDALAMREPRLVVLNVGGSESKAENINAAVQVATGDVIGIFDCDHHPEPRSYERAWRWLANGADVVQGRCAVRRAENTFLSALVAAEFEQMYTVGHPGRARAFGFGLFGGSNGYWRAAALKAVRFDPSAPAIATRPCGYCGSAAGSSPTRASFPRSCRLPACARSATNAFAGPKGGSRSHDATLLRCGATTGCRCGNVSESHGSSAAAR